MKKKIVYLLFVVLVLSFFAGCDRAKLNFSHMQAPGSVWDKGAEKFALLVDKNSNGHTRVNVHPAGKLCSMNPVNELELLKTGKVDFAWISASLMANKADPRFGVFNLPWLFSSHKLANNVFDDRAGAIVEKWFDEQGLVCLGIGNNGFRQLSNNEKKIEYPNDLRGLRILVPGGKSYSSVFNMMGAVAVPMSPVNIKDALAKGMAEGQEGNLQSFADAKLFEQQKFLTLWNYMFDPIFLCANKNMIEKLEPEKRDAVKSAAKEAVVYERQLIVESEEELKKELKAKGVKVTSLPQGRINKFRTIAMPIYKNMESTVGAEVLLEIRRIIGASEHKMKLIKSCR